MDMVTTITSIIALISLVVIIAIAMSSFIKEYKQRGVILELKERSKVFHNVEYLENTLNNFILERFEDYRIKNIDKFDVDFITDSSQKEITKNVLESVLNTISPAFKSYLCMIYNAEIIDQIIADKVIMTIMSYVIDNNNNSTNV